MKTSPPAPSKFASRPSIISCAGTARIWSSAARSKERSILRLWSWRGGSQTARPRWRPSLPACKPSRREVIDNVDRLCQHDCVYLTQRTPQTGAPGFRSVVVIGSGAGLCALVRCHMRTVLVLAACLVIAPYGMAQRGGGRGGGRGGAQPQQPVAPPNP